MSGIDSAEFNTHANDRTRVFHAGANWFFWIAGLSIVNSLVAVFEGEWGFIIGLGITQLVDGLALAIAAEASGSAATIIKFVAFVFDVFVAMIFVMFGWMARKRHAWAFVAGMLLYLLDGLLFLLIGDIIGIIFHGVALFFIYGGYAAFKNLRDAELMAQLEPA